MKPSLQIISFVHRRQTNGEGGTKGERRRIYRLPPFSAGTGGQCTLTRGTSRSA